MTIPYFGPNQNLVFVPAMLALLAATVVICLPIVFAPSLRRSSRRTPMLALAVVLAVVALVGTGLLAVRGFGTLGSERADVKGWIANTYGVQLDSGQVGELIDGGKPEPPLPSKAAAAGLDPTKKHPLELVPTTTGGDVYTLTIGGKPMPGAS